MDLQRLRRVPKAVTKQYIADQKVFVRRQSSMTENYKVEHQFRAAWDLINCMANRKIKKKSNILETRLKIDFGSGMRTSAIYLETQTQPTQISNPRPLTQKST
jgi:hypothetical protein